MQQGTLHLYVFNGRVEGFKILTSPAMSSFSSRRSCDTKLQINRHQVTPAFINKTKQQQGYICMFLAMLIQPDSEIDHADLRSVIFLANQTEEYLHKQKEKSQHLARQRQLIRLYRSVRCKRRLTHRLTIFIREEGD